MTSWTVSPKRSARGPRRPKGKLFLLNAVTEFAKGDPKNNFNISPSRYIHTGAGEECRLIAEIVEGSEALEAEAMETDRALKAVFGRIMK